MKHNNKPYVHGTAAKKIEYNVYEENKVLKAKRVRKSNNKEKLKVFSVVLIAFVLGVAIMYRYALITQQSYELDSLQKQYQDIKNKNIGSQVAIEKDMDLAKVKETAEKKLGMQEPDKYQVVYVKVPKNDYTKVADKYQGAQENQSMFASLYDKVSKFASLLY